MPTTTAAAAAQQGAHRVCVRACDDLQATETEIRLLLLQKELESETGERDFVGGSLTDTLFRLITSRNLKRAQKIKSDFKVMRPHPVCSLARAALCTSEGERTR
jgi:hypothetical protein